MRKIMIELAEGLNFLNEYSKEARLARLRDRRERRKLKISEDRRFFAFKIIGGAGFIVAVYLLLSHL